MRRPEFVARQGRRPEGLFGRLLASFMAWETSKENDAALDLLEIRPGDRVLEIGFGHGRSIAAAANMAPVGLVAGVDASPDMVALAKECNRALVDRGLADLRQADSLHLPFADATFDKAFSVHTIYFWSAPVLHMQEVRRVLKDSGRFVLGFRPESERTRRSFPASVYTFRAAEEITEMLLSAGFPSVSLVDRGATSRGTIFAVACTVKAPAVSDPANNVCRQGTSP